MSDLLLYMGFNFAKINPTTKNTVNVGGVFYGNVEPDKDGNVNIPLGNKTSLSKGKIDVTGKTPANDQKDPDSGTDEPTSKPEPVKPDVKNIKF